MDVVTPSSTTLHNFPITVLTEITNSLSKLERARLREVCCDLALFINEYYGIDLIITNQNCQYLFAQPYNDKLKEVKLVSVTRDIPNNIMFAGFVRKLEFVRIVASYNLFQLINSFPALEDITFRSILLEKTKNLQIDPEFAPIAKLKRIHFAHDSTIPIVNETEEFIFSVLSKFSLDTLAIFIIGKETPNSSRREELEIEENNGWQIGLTQGRNTVNPATISHISTIIAKSQLTLEKLNLGNTIALNFHGVALTQMPLLELQAKIGHRSDWPTFLGVQTKLTKLYVELAVNVWEDVEKCIQACSNTLRDVKIVSYYDVDVQDQNPPTHNVNFLRNVTHIRRLHLETQITEKVFDHWPTTLENLTIDSPLDDVHLTKIINSSPILKSLNLMRFGSYVRALDGNISLEKGIDTEMLKNMILMPMIQKIRCTLSANTIGFCLEHQEMLEVRDTSGNLVILGQTIPNFKYVEVKLLPGFDREKIV